MASAPANIAIQRYPNRYFIHPFSRNLALPEADVVVVIPCYGEPSLALTLDSLLEASPISVKILVLVVVNEPEDAPEEKRLLNRAALEMAERYNVVHPEWPLVFLDARGLAQKNAGVGLARKIGMDAVVLQPWARPDTTLVCLDADCVVAKVYWQALEQFYRDPKSRVAVLAFEHPLDPARPVQTEGIVAYEAFLEYYRLGLWLAGYPYFAHTVGSSMAVKADAYTASGGMNQRKAGEDFYFLHKLFPVYPLRELEGPLVFPSPRISDRVPFGTGRFQQSWAEGKKSGAFTYHPEVFRLLGTFLEEARAFLQSEAPKPAFPRFDARHPRAEAYRNEEDLEALCIRCRNASPRADRRLHRFFSEFDGFKVLRFVHFFAALFPAVSPWEGIRDLWTGLPGPGLPGNPSDQIRAVRRHLSKKPEAPPLSH